MRKSTFHRLGVMVVAAAAAIVLPACTTTSTKDSRGNVVLDARAVNADVDAALARLYTSVPDARSLVARSAGVLVFPDVKGASMIIGGEGGTGTLRERGQTTGYYSLKQASLGLQAGVQSKTVVYVFMTPDALNDFKNSNGWTAGVSATVAVAKVGADGHLDTETGKQAVVGFSLNNSGFEAGVSFDGAKITKITR